MICRNPNCDGWNRRVGGPILYIILAILCHILKMIRLRGEGCGVAVGGAGFRTVQWGMILGGPRKARWVRMECSHVPLNEKYAVRPPFATQQSWTY